MKIKFSPELISELQKRFPQVDKPYWESVSPNVYDSDEMFDHSSPQFWAAAHYLGVGYEALGIIENALSAINKPKSSIKNILDFPCGYGRVTRHLINGFPEAEITGSEIFESCNDFCSEAFGINTFLSDQNFSIKQEKKYDIIWCGSLFTHLSAKRHGLLLDFFDSQLADNGVLIYTVHGRYVSEKMKTYNYLLSRSRLLAVKIGYKLFGYGYSDYNKQSKGYGISLNSPTWLFNEIFSRENYRVISFHERGWDSHQDVIVIQKKRVNDGL